MTDFEAIAGDAAIRAREDRETQLLMMLDEVLAEIGDDPEHSDIYRRTRSQLDAFYGVDVDVT
jgi:two-component SAPR family response regulator